MLGDSAGDSNSIVRRIIKENSSNLSLMTEEKTTIPCSRTGGLRTFIGQFVHLVEGWILVGFVILAS